MPRKPVLCSTVNQGTMDYISKIAKRYSISKSKVIDLIAFSNECEVDMDTLDYIFTNLFKIQDGRKGRTMPKKSGV